jgi:hypothetical protein
MLTSLQA